MKKEKIKVYLYTRVSTTIQIDGYSLDAQKTKMRAFCNYNEYEIELTDEELEDLRYKNCTANISSKSRYNPHVFTEQGLYMLMTVLKEPLAVKQSKALISSFNFRYRFLEMARK